MTAVNWPAGHVEGDAAQGVHGGLAVAVAAGDRAGRDGRAGGVAGRGRGRGGMEQGQGSGPFDGVESVQAVAQRAMRSTARPSAPARRSAAVASAATRPNRPPPGRTETEAETSLPPSVGVAA